MGNDGLLPYVLDSFINYLANVKNYSHRTLPGYRSSLQKFFEAQGIRTPSDITPAVTEDYLARRKLEGIKQNTNATFMNALRAFLIFTNKHGYTTAQLEMFEVPRRELTRIQFVTPDEVNRMVGCLPRERDRLILLTLYTSGARISELIQLSMENWHENSFKVVGKGNRPMVYYFDPTVSDRLRAFCMVQGTTTGPVFRDTTGRPIGQAAVSHMVRKAAKLANISRNVFPHQFRHGFATAALEAGADPRTIQEMLGHTQIQTTMRYMHVTDQRKRETHNKYAPKVTDPNTYQQRYTQNVEQNWRL